MKIPISHETVEKLLSLLEACYYDITHIDNEMWADFNLVEITQDLMDGDYHREGVLINITDDTANWLEAISEDSEDDDMKLIAESVKLNFSITILD